MPRGEGERERPPRQLPRRASVPRVEVQELARLAGAEGEDVEPQPEPRRVVGAREGEEQGARRERSHVASARREGGSEPVHGAVEGLVGGRMVRQVRLATHPRADEGGVEGELVRVDGARQELARPVGLPHLRGDLLQLQQRRQVAPGWG